MADTITIKVDLNNNNKQLKELEANAKKGAIGIGKMVNALDLFGIKSKIIGSVKNAISKAFVSEFGESLELMKDKLNQGMVKVVKSLNDSLINTGIIDLNSIMIKVSGGIENTLNHLANSIPAIVNRITEIYASLERWMPLIKSIAIGVAASALAFGVYNSVAATIGKVTMAIKVLSAVLTKNPWVLVIAGVITVISLLNECYQKNVWFSNLINLIWSKVSGIFEDAFASISKVVEMGMEFITSFFQEKLALIKTFWEENGTRILDAISSTMSVLSGLVSKAMDFISQIFQNALDIIQEFWENNGTWIVDTLTTTMEIISKAIGLAFNFIINITSKALEQIYMFWEENGAWIMEILTSTMEVVGTIISEAMAFISEIISGALEQIQLFWEENGAWIMEILTSTMEVVGTIISEAMAFISEIISGALEQIQLFWEENGAWIMEILSFTFEFIKTVIEDTMTIITEFIFENLEKVKAFWEENGEAILEKVILAWNTIEEIIRTVLGDLLELFLYLTETVKELWQKHGEDIIHFAYQAWENIKKFIDASLTVITTIVSKAMNMIKTVFEFIWPFISKIVQVQWEWIKTVIKTGIDVIAGIINMVMALIKGDWEGVWESIKNIASDIFNNIMDFFKNINLFDIGKNIIDGLIRGITEKVGSVLKTVSNIASNIKGTISKALGINSPSKWMRDMIGKNMMLGWEIGVDQEKRSVLNKANDMTEWMKPNVQDLMSGLKGLSVPVTQVRNSGNNPINAHQRMNSSQEQTDQKQPAIINVHVGAKKIAAEIVEDITQLQERVKNRQRRTSVVRGAYV
ncbi:hypothetical protein BTS2_2125 [Bacillus sp. TS-2]|nr:hypothetical protein BTS2_2125 [Bacillus sp. TS-2]